MSIHTGKIGHMALRYALLGLLGERPSSGYDLSRRFAAGIGTYAWDAKHSQIYPELRKLLDDGAIEVAEEGARGRKTYAITDAGREELRAWLLTGPTSTGGVRNEHALRLFLLSALEPDEAVQMLTRTADHAEQQVDSLSTELENIAAAHDGDITRYGGLAAQYGILAYQATADWARWAIREIRRSERRRH